MRRSLNHMEKFAQLLLLYLISGFLTEFMKSNNSDYGQCLVRYLPSSFSVSLFLFLSFVSLSFVLFSFLSIGFFFVPLQRYWAKFLFVVADVALKGCLCLFIDKWLHNVRSLDRLLLSAPPFAAHPPRE